MAIDSNLLQIINSFTISVLGKINRTISRKITTTFQDSDDLIPSSKLVKDEFATVRSEIPTKTSDLTNDGEDGSHIFIEEGDRRLTDSRNPNLHTQPASTITDTATYSNIGNLTTNQASINSAINDKIGTLMNLDIIEQVSTRPTASAETMNKIYAVPENDPTSENLFQYFVTVYENNAYKWDKIDIAKIDLSDYVKKNNIDTTLIQSSTNPVSGGAVYTAIENAKTSINNNLAAVATSGNYNDLTNKPSIPTKISDLTNDSEFIIEDNIDDVLDEFLKQSAFVSSNKSIIQSGENSILTARIFGIPSTQNIEFYEKKANGSSILLDTIPLNNGIATYNYIGSGAGSKQFYIKSGSIQSKPFVTTDGSFYDKALDGTGNHNDNWGNPNTKVNVSRSATGTTLTMDSGVTWGQLYAQSQSTYFDLPFAVELKSIDYSDTPTIRFANESSTSATHILTGGNWKISFNSDSITVLKDGESQTHYLNTLIGSTKLKVYLELSAYTDMLKYKDFVIYPI